MAATSIDVLLTEMLELLLVRFREYLRLQHESAVIKLELQHSLLLHLSLSLSKNCGLGDQLFLHLLTLHYVWIRTLRTVILP